MDDNLMLLVNKTKYKCNTQTVDKQINIDNKINDLKKFILHTIQTNPLIEQNIDAYINFIDKQVRIITLEFKKELYNKQN